MKEIRLFGIPDQRESRSAFDRLNMAASTVPLNSVRHAAAVAIEINKALGDLVLSLESSSQIFISRGLVVSLHAIHLPGDV